MILGFGSTETNQQEMVKEWIFNTFCELYKERLAANEHALFSEELLSDFAIKFKKYKQEIYDHYCEFDRMIKKPERYFHFYFTNDMAITSFFFFINLKFWHINSRHLGGPALMQTEKLVGFSYEDCRKKLGKT